MGSVKWSRNGGSGSSSPSRFVCAVLISSWLLCAGSASAQQTTLPGVLPSDYQGVGSVDGRMYYLLHPKQAITPTYYFQLFDENLTLLRPIEMKFGQVAEVEATVASGDRFFFYFSSHKEGRLIAYNKEGTEVAQASFEAPSKFLNKPMLYPRADKGILIVRPFKDKKSGLRMEALDADLKSLWQRDFIPEKGELEILSLSVSDDRIVALVEGKKAFEVIAVSSDGKELFHTPLQADEKIKINPTDVAVANDGSVGVFGRYDTREFIKVGLRHYFHFLATFSPTGQQTSLDYGQWSDDVAAKIRSHSSVGEYSADQPDLYVHKMMATPDGFRLLGESYRFALQESGPPPQTRSRAGSAPPMSTSVEKNLYFFAMDLLLIDLDRKGQVQTVRRVPKPAMRTTSRTLTGLPTDPKYSLRDHQDFNRFGYRFSVQNASGEQEHVVVNESYNLTQVAFLGPKDAYDNPLRRDHPGVPAIKVGSGGELASRTADFRAFNDHLQDHNYTNVLPSASGGYVLAWYNGRDVVLEKRKPSKEGDSSVLSDWPSADASALGRYPGGGEYAYQRLESGEDGGSRYGLVLTDRPGGTVVANRTLNLPREVGQYANNDHLLLVHRKDMTDVMVNLGPKGKVDETREIPAASKHGKPAPESSQYLSNGAEGFIRIQPFTVDEKTMGYQLLGLDNSLAERFDVAEKVSFEEKGGRLRVSRGVVSGQHLVLLEELQWMKRDTPQRAEKLVFIDRMTGKVLSRSELNQNTTYLAPDVISGSGVAGVWFEQEKELEPKGLFLQPLLPGAPAVRLAWNDIAVALGDARLGKFLTTGQLRLRPRELVTAKGQYMLVMEGLLSRSERNSPYEYRTGEGNHTDFVVLTFDKTGKAVGGHFIPAIPGPDVTAPHYRYLEPDGAGGFSLVFDGVLANQPLAFSTPVEATANRKYTSAPAFLAAEPVKVVEKPTNAIVRFQANLESAVDRFEKAMGATSPPPPYVADTNTGFVQGSRGSIIVYRYDPLKRKMQWEERKFE